MNIYTLIHFQAKIKVLLPNMLCHPNWMHQKGWGFLFEYIGIKKFIFNASFLRQRYLMGNSIIKCIYVWRNCDTPTEIFMHLFGDPKISTQKKMEKLLSNYSSTLIKSCQEINKRSYLQPNHKIWLRFNDK